MVKIVYRIKKVLITINQAIVNRKRISNYYNTDYNKKVLIAYLTTAFKHKNSYRHSNTLEGVTAAEIFNELGYQVDVANYNSSLSIDFSNYDVVYGMGTLFERSFYSQSKKLKRIFYATGCNPIYSNIATTLKVRSFFELSNLLIPESSRIIKESQHFQILLSDAVIVLGNEYVKSTYLKYDTIENRYSNLNAFYFDVHIPDVSKKNFKTARNHFVWFGSSGALHKGLDIAIEYFLVHPELTLHICGLSNTESKFFNFYKDRIESSDNILNHGFVDITSDLFINIMNGSCFALFPSISEGGAPALLNVIANGALIPIYSKSTGVDLEEFGCEVEEITIDAFSDAINSMLQLDDEQLAYKAQSVLEFVRKNYTYSIYKNNLRNIICKVL